MSKGFQVASPSDEQAREYGDSLQLDVEASYFRPVTAEFRDFGTDMTWRAEFVADHSLWRLSVANSPDAEVLPDDAKAFFASRYFLKFAKRCGDILDDARQALDKTAEPLLRDGRLLQVNEVKLARIEHDLDTAHYMENLRNGKYELV